MVEKIIYDLDTVRYLRQYSRLKETLPFLPEIFKTADDLHFPAIFWQQEFADGMKMGDVRKKIEYFSLHREEVSDQTLASLDYSRFLDILEEWIAREAHDYRQMMKPANQKKMESLFRMVCWLTIGGSLAVMLFFWVGYRNQGLSAEFFKGMNFEQSLFMTNSKTLNFSHYLEMDPRAPSERFSVRWRGSLMVSEAAEYTLNMVVDDGARLFLDDQLVFDEWSDHDSASFEKTLFLDKGKHRLQLEYFNHQHDARLKLFWKKGADGEKKIIPSSHFFPDSL